MEIASCPLFHRILASAGGHVEREEWSDGVLFREASIHKNHSFFMKFGKVRLMDSCRMLHIAWCFLVCWTNIHPYPTQYNAGVSILRYLGRTLPRKNSHFSWFYKKLGPFYKKLNFEWQSIFQHCMSSGWLTYTGIWSGGFIVFKVMTHRESMYFFQYFPYRIDHIC